MSDPETAATETADTETADTETAATETAAEYTIDELAAITGVPSRTIRFYQSKGTLPAPERRGRVAVYGPEHVERLGVIAELQDRGLRLDAIREVLDVVASGGDSLQSWLGVGDRLQAPWSDDRPTVWSHEELSAKVGNRPSFIAEAERVGIIERRSNSRPPAYLILSPRLFDISLRLDEAGIDLTTAVGAERILRKRIGRAADELVGWFSEQLGHGFAGGGDADSVASAFEVLRSLGVEATQLVFAQEMERSLRDFVEKGGMVSTVKKAGKAKG
jgi:DNA-binding transcriptional MerR regulator